MTKQVRVGFVGCGGIANWHFSHFEKNQQAKIVAVCDLIDERVQKAADRFKATPYADYRRMLAKEKLDALYVCVEPCAHDGMELLAVEKGCHLFVQKPVALSMAYANRVKAAVKKAGVISSVGYQTRYMDFMPRIKGWLEMQEVAFVNAYYVGGMPTVWWWRRRDTSGGQVVEQTTHAFDLLRFLFGDVASVQAMGSRGLMTAVETYDTEDCSAVTLKFKSGLVGSVYSACCLDHGGKYGIEVYCKKGKLEFFGNTYKITEKNLTIEGKALNDNGQDIDDTFIEAVRSGDPTEVLTDYADACRTLEVTLAANTSMDAGGELVRLR